MKFREATKADFDQIEPLCEEFHRDTRFGYIPYSKDKVLAIGQQALREPKTHGILVAVQGQNIIGFIYCSAGAYFIGEGVVIVTVQVFYIARTTRETILGGKAALGLIRLTRNWAKARGASELVINATSGMEAQRTARFLARAGFTALGENYARKL